MAVIVKYIVERNGVEKMTFTSKKEADAYDKMLDVADELSAFIGGGPVALDDAQREELGLFLAANKDELQTLLKGGKPKEVEPKDKKQPKVKAVA